MRKKIIPQKLNGWWLDIKSNKTMTRLENKSILGNVIYLSVHQKNWRINNTTYIKCVRRTFLINPLQGTTTYCCSMAACLSKLRFNTSYATAKWVFKEFLKLLSYLKKKKLCNKTGTTQEEEYSYPSGVSENIDWFLWGSLDCQIDLSVEVCRIRQLQICFYSFSKPRLVFLSVLLGILLLSALLGILLLKTSFINGLTLDDPAPATQQIFLVNDNEESTNEGKTILRNTSLIYKT